MSSSLNYLILGRGYVGQRFAQELTRRGESHRLLSRAEFDYTQPGALLQFLAQAQPRFVVNAAGFTGKPNVDACETQREACYFANAVLPHRIAEACAQHHIPWGHVSSGCIYTGNGPTAQGFSEEDAPNFSFAQGNCSYYSGTKALGEAKLKGQPQTYIWRLRIPFDGAMNPRNYLSKVLTYERLLDARNSVSHLDDFVASCLACFEKNVPYGTYNLTNPGSVTTREVVAALQQGGVTDKAFSFFASEAEFMRVAAQTPRSNCVLDTRKSEAAGIALRPVKAALEDAISQLLTPQNLAA